MRALPALAAALVALAVVGCGEDSAEDEVEALRQSGMACREAEPEPVSDGGGVRFSDIPASRLDALLATAPEVLRTGTVQAADVTQGQRLIGSLLLIPGLVGEDVRADFLAGARGGVSAADGRAQDVTIAGSQAVLAFVPGQYAGVIGFTGCYGFAAYARDRATAERIAQRVLGG
jgi:hypothetical protein